MERVTFLVEEDNQRISGMLNPETVLMWRTAGVRPRESLSGLINADRRGDNPVLFTGSGNTCLELDLVFDTSIPGSTIESQDVRDLTRPLWNLTENYQRNDRSFRPALCRFIWGKCWNIPGVVSAIAEKLESFSPQGIPRRSWLRLRLIRMQENPHTPLNKHEVWSPSAEEGETINPLAETLQSAGTNMPAAGRTSDMFENESEIPENLNERIDLSAHHHTGDASRWREIANRLNITRPLLWLENLLPDQNAISDTEGTSNE